MLKTCALVLSTVLVAATASAETVRVSCKANKDVPVKGLQFSRATLVFDSANPSKAKMKFSFTSLKESFSVSGMGRITEEKLGEADIWIAKIMIDSQKYSHAYLMMDPIDTSLVGEFDAIGGIFRRSDGEAAGAGILTCVTR